jgi:outer membrane protein
MKKNTIVMIAAGLLMLCTTACNNNTKENPNATAPVVSENGLKIAYIDTDTLLAKYQYAIDMQKEMEAYTEKQRSYGQQQVDAFQRDYNNYLQNGSTMTLTQQQQKEAELKTRAEKMQTLEQELMAKIAEKQNAETLKIMNANYAFVREYNEANQKFDVILTKQATLYMNSGMDITNEIVEGLNAEYKKVKSKE